MIRSMTAYARIASETPLGVATWELRTVNNRYLDQALRLPEEFRALDPGIRERVSARLGRGKLDCSLKLQTTQASATAVTLNLDLAAQVAQACAQISTLMPSSATLSPMEILRWPGVVEAPPVDVEGASVALFAGLEAALTELVATREREGARLGALISQRCDGIERIVAEVAQILPAIIDNTRTRIRTKLTEVSAELDSNRVEQEMVLFAQKVDVAEELDRLTAHVQEVREVLLRDEPTGRRLDFLMQELNREANTLGSKSVDTTITRASVDLKVLIEQMREQVQNVE
jgi:uncharacterized protein (TIGR00255 family)